MLAKRAPSARHGEPVHEALASLGAVLGGTLVDVDKTTGPYNWVAMTREYYVNRNTQFIVLNTPFSVSGQSAWYETYPNILFYSIADRYPGESSLQTILNTVDLRFYDAVNVLTAGGTAPNFNYTAYDFRTRQPVYNGVWREPDMGLGMAWLQHAAYWRKRDVRSQPGGASPGGRRLGPGLLRNPLDQSQLRDSHIVWRLHRRPHECRAGA